MRTVTELTAIELEELKEAYFHQLVDLGEENFSNSSELPLENVIAHYEGVLFSEDDFFCNSSNTTVFEQLEDYRINYPELTFDNKGYEGLTREVKEKYKVQIEEISNLLKSVFPRFRSFQNFKPYKDGSFGIRCQVAYDVAFTGVYYYTEEDFPSQQP